MEVYRLSIKFLKPINSTLSFDFLSEIELGAKTISGACELVAVIQINDKNVFDKKIQDSYQEMITEKMNGEIRVERGHLINDQFVFIDLVELLTVP